VISKTANRCVCCWLSESYGPALPYRRENDTDPKLPQAFVAYLEACAVHCYLDCCGTNALKLSVEAGERWALDVGSEVAPKTLTELDELITELGTREAPVHCLTDMWVPSHLQMWIKECRDILQEGIQKSERI
jgi:hypothetical protein